MGPAPLTVACVMLSVPIRSIVWRSRPLVRPHSTVSTSSLGCVVDLIQLVGWLIRIRIHSGNFLILVLVVIGQFGFAYGLSSTALLLFRAL